MQEYAVGTIEYLIVDVTDRLENLASLDGYDLRFSVKRKDTGASVYTNQSASNLGMSVKCLIDTTSWELAVYQLWITIVASPESPRLGPFEFRVID